MIEHQLVKGGVIAVRDQGLGLLVIESPGLIHQPQEGTPAVVQMRHPMLDFGGAERVDIKAHTFAVPAIAVPFQCPHLVERDPQIALPKGLSWSNFSPF